MRRPRHESAGGGAVAAAGVATAEAGTASEPGTASLRAERQQLVSQVLGGALDAADFPQRYAAAADSWLAGLLARASDGSARGLALVAVGGYGAGSLSPASDLDLVLLHRWRRGHGEVARRIWYVIWDEGIKLDHSVRSPGEALEVARSDLKALLGLLDLRLVSGDGELAGRVRDDVASWWRRQLPALLAAVEGSVSERHEAAGELAFLLEPDLKQSAGGLRDLALLRVLGVALGDTAERYRSAPLRRAERSIQAARAALQCAGGAGGDRLVLQEQDRIAPLLNFADADLLMGELAHAGRTVTAALEQAWREAHAGRRAASGRPASAPLELGGGVTASEDEVLLDAGADRADPVMPLRLARAAAERHVLISPAALGELAAAWSGEVPAPWPAALRQELLAVIAAGPPAVSALEALDRHGLLARYLPEWAAVRNKPQRNAYHRFTVDRHLLEAAVLAAAEESERPDLLVTGALLHDIGKGFPGDHSESGAEIAEQIARRMGFAPADVAVLRRLVAYHLLLPEVATRRDLDDPGTAQLVARLVEDRGTLRLLEALTRADAAATGPTAWGPWKADLVATLVARAERVLAGDRLPAPAPLQPTASQREAFAERRLAVEAVGGRVSIVAPDRHGVLAAAAGVLALNGCSVRRATAGPGDNGMALDLFHVEPAFDRRPDWQRVGRDLEAVLAGELALSERLASQDRAYASTPGRRTTRALRPSVTVDNEGSERCTIVEVRAPDRFGLLYRITSTLAGAGLDVTSAMVDTLGHEVVDAFYVQRGDGCKLAEPDETAAVRQALELALSD